MDHAEQARKMHRRAQRAEGGLDRMSFWIDCLCEAKAKDYGTGYMQSVARCAKMEIDRTLRKLNNH